MIYVIIDRRYVIDEKLVNLSLVAAVSKICTMPFLHKTMKKYDFPIYSKKHFLGEPKLVRLTIMVKYWNYHLHYFKDFFSTSHKL